MVRPSNHNTFSPTSVVVLVVVLVLLLVIVQCKADGISTVKRLSKIQEAQLPSVRRNDLGDPHNTPSRVTCGVVESSSSAPCSEKPFITR